MEPFLNAVVIRLETLIETDSPFLQEERKTWLERLKRLMTDAVPLGEKMNLSKRCIVNGISDLGQGESSRSAAPVHGNSES